MLARDDEEQVREDQVEDTADGEDAADDGEDGPAHAAPPYGLRRGVASHAVPSVVPIGELSEKGRA